MVTLLGINALMAGVDWMTSQTVDRFPNLKIILSEGGAGWVPYVLERADKVYLDQRIAGSEELGFRDKGSRMPSQVFAEQMYVCLVDEHFALRSLEDIPIDNLLWEGDYPHGDGLWPNNHSYLEKALEGVPEEQAAKIAGDTLRGLLAR
jgi:predicted TIM-barrel fold metal-dependent hydrolase